MSKQHFNSSTVHNLSLKSASNISLLEKLSQSSVNVFDIMESIGDFSSTLGKLGDNHWTLLLHVFEQLEPTFFQLSTL